MKLRPLLAAAAFAAAVIVGIPSAHAATVAVDIKNFGFSPPSVTVGQGGTVKWTQLDIGTEHTSTSNQGFWHSPDLATGQSYSQTAAFMNAGSYGYHCSIHTDMTAVVHVPIKAGGAASTGWRVRWSSLSTTPSNRAFDVQIKRPGSTRWAAFRTGTARRSAFFNPAKNGTYAFRARTKNLGNGRNSGWSPTKSVKIS